MITQSDLSGHWRRDWINAPGYSDTTTQVHWLQAGDGTYADIRVPATRPDLGTARCLAELPQSVLAQLRAAEGFAGDITVDAGVCTWARQLNLHGHPAPIDSGRMSWSPEGGLFEDGVHADYRELWQRVPAAPFRARVQTEAGRRISLIWNDALFLIGSEPEIHPADPDLVTALTAGRATEEAIRAGFAGQYTLGTWEGDIGIATLSTNPFAEGQPALTRSETGYHWLETGFEGDPHQHTLPRSNISLEISS